jgi:hypothetical protein
MITRSEMEERRITLRLLAYWEKLRRDRKMPKESDIFAADIADLWEYCFIARIKDGEWYFHYMGRAIKEAYNEVMAKGSGEQVAPSLDILAPGYEQVVNKSGPLVLEGELHDAKGGDLFKYRQVLLPMGEGDKITSIFGGMRFLRIVNYK